MDLLDKTWLNLFKRISSDILYKQTNFPLIITRIPYTREHDTASFLVCFHVDFNVELVPEI